MSGGNDRSEAPTPKRLADARARGLWPSSACASLWLSLAFLVLPLSSLAALAAGWSALWRAGALDVVALVKGQQSSAHVLTTFVAWLNWRQGWCLVGLVWAAALLGSVLTAAATGALTIAPAALLSRLDRLSWKMGVAQLIVRDPWQAPMAVCAFAITVWWSWPMVICLIGVAASHANLAASLGVVTTVLKTVWLRALAAFGALALIDVLRIRTRTTASLRMTAREVRDERRETEGRPELKNRRRSAAARLTRNVDIGAIAQATAVIANPTHVAIALRYAPPSIDVPLVVSRGADLAAGLVRAIAAVHDVPIIEAPELARVLFARATLGEPIPEECFTAVAAVFAFLLQTRGVLRGAELL
ncbi:MAG: EscU/YscU/HrcU family type III secretion system export apparatus switch protein [Candidatus Eremiobacteraeota bacterium]|nr:EscU/YscU/HrcU family type III secretion system export apparatus switch protein [Candidatus Eremiobacteraeota bacterium]